MKEREVIIIETIKENCYRETKFGETEQAKCLFDYKELNDKCYDCRWIEQKKEKVVSLTNEHKNKLQEFLKTIEGK